MFSRKSFGWNFDAVWKFIGIYEQNFRRIYYVFTKLYQYIFKIIILEYILYSILYLKKRKEITTILCSCNIKLCYCNRPAIKIHKSYENGENFCFC